MPEEGARGQREKKFPLQIHKFFMTIIFTEDLVLTHKIDPEKYWKEWETNYFVTQTKLCQYFHYDGMHICTHMCFHSLKICTKTLLLLYKKERKSIFLKAVALQILIYLFILLFLPHFYGFPSCPIWMILGGLSPL